MKKVLINIAYYLVLFFKYFYIYTHNFFTWFYNLLAKVFKWNVKFYYAQEQTSVNKALNKPKKTNTKSNKEKETIDFEQKFEDCNTRGQRLFKKYKQKLNENKALSKDITNLKSEIQGLEDCVTRQKEEIKCLKQPVFIKTETRTALDVLGLKTPFTQKELKKAYNQLVNRYHPDKHIHMSKTFQAETNDEFIKIKASYNKLKTI